MRCANKLVRLATAVVAAGLAAASSAMAAPVSWADYFFLGGPHPTAANYIGSVPSTPGYRLWYTGEALPQTVMGCGSGHPNYWATSGGAPWISATASNAPDDCSIIAVQGGPTKPVMVLGMPDGPVQNLVMAIFSLGQGSGGPTTFQFDRPFTILSSNGGLSNPSGNILAGNEGNGLILFQGSVSSISWTMPTSEFWTGFTFGILDASAFANAPAPGALSLVGFGIAGLWLARRRQPADSVPVKTSAA